MARLTAAASTAALMQRGGRPRVKLVACHVPPHMPETEHRQFWSMPAASLWLCSKRHKSHARESTQPSDEVPTHAVIGICHLIGW